MRPLLLAVQVAGRAEETPIGYVRTSAYPPSLGIVVKPIKRMRPQL